MIQRDFKHSFKISFIKVKILLIIRMINDTRSVILCTYLGDRVNLARLNSLVILEEENRLHNLSH